MRSCCSLDQLGSNADPTARLAYGAFEGVADAQFVADLLYVDGLAFISEARAAGDHKEPADPGERGDDLLDHAVAKVFLLGVAAHVLERQHRDRRLVGQGQRRLRRHCSRRLGGVGPFAEQYTVDAYRPRDVLDLLLAHVLDEKASLSRT